MLSVSPRGAGGRGAGGVGGITWQLSHRSSFFTQGLLVINGSFVEGTGRRNCGSRVAAYSTTDGVIAQLANIDCTKVGVFF